MDKQAEMLGDAFGPIKRRALLNRTNKDYARSAEIIHSPVMETLVWMRVPGDILFAIGALLLALYAFRLLGWGKPQAVAFPGGATATR